jgi:hypothetical protein
VEDKEGHDHDQDNQYSSLMFRGAHVS